MCQIRVLIVDDHTIVRQGLRMILNTEPTIQVVGEALNAPNAVNLSSQIQPDVVLMDLVMPGGSGIEAIARIKQRSTHVKIIVLTTFADDKRIHEAMTAGADGYILKDADGEALIRAIHAARRNEMPLHPRIARHLFRDSFNGHVSELEKKDSLTAREQDVLQLVTKGLSNKKIAELLDLCEGTVKVYVSNILSKLNVSSRTEAAVRAVQMGWAAPPDDV